MYLLDTNLLSPRTAEPAENAQEDDAEEVGDLLRGVVMVTSSVCAQEVLGMQQSRKEQGYRYALPVLPKRLTHRSEHGLSLAQHARHMIDHHGGRAVSPLTDRRGLPQSRLRAASLELGHEAVAATHQHGFDEVFSTFAKRGLSGVTLKRVLRKWEFLREDVAEILPLDDLIVDRGLTLANAFADSQRKVKGTTRNTMNDMLVAATAQVHGLELLTGDTQLKTFYENEGWIVKQQGPILVASPPTEAAHEASPPAKRRESRGYINRPEWLRTRDAR